MIIYKITNKLNGKIYIGRTTRTLKERIYQHIHSPLSYIGKAIREDGYENFDYEIVEHCKSIEELKTKENIWISHCDCIFPKGYNRVGGVKSEVSETESRPASRPLNNVFRMIRSKWKIAIIFHLYYFGVMRYGELKRKIEGISNTMLANSLQELESDNLIKRTLYDEMPLRVEYELTPLCKSLIPLLLELNAWVAENIP